MKNIQNNQDLEYFLRSVRNVSNNYDFENFLKSLPEIDLINFAPILVYRSVLRVSLLCIDRVPADYMHLTIFRTLALCGIWDRVPPKSIEFARAQTRKIARDIDKSSQTSIKLLALATAWAAWSSKSAWSLLESSTQAISCAENALRENVFWADWTNKANENNNSKQNRKNSVVATQAFWRAVRQDVTILLEGEKDLRYTKLWHEQPHPEFANVNFKKWLKYNQQNGNEHWDVWIKFYIDGFKGHYLFNDGIVLALGTLDTKQWNQNPFAINKDIKKFAVI